MGRLRIAMETVWMRTRGRGLSLRRIPSLPRAGAGAVAMAVLLLTVGLSSSRPRPEREVGERFGEIHWCETEKSP